jgi:oligoribonuclease
MTALIPSIIWVDCEMTGLNPQTDSLVEVAVVITDDQLQQIGDGISIVIKPSAVSLAAISEHVKSMHQASGLYQELESGVDLATAEQLLADYLAGFALGSSKLPIAGNSITMDRIFLEKYLPTFYANIHYRSIDVTTIKELARRWSIRVYSKAPGKVGNHRALGDIKDSIAELDYYRQEFFKIQP